MFEQIPLRQAWPRVLGACCLCLVLWCLTPNMFGERHLLHRVISDEYTQLVVELVVTCCAAAILLLLVKDSRQVLGLDRSIRWWYALPIVLAVSVPFHYHWSMPMALYIVFSAVSVFWQQFVTFGLLQTSLCNWLSARWSVTLTVVMFYAAHAVLLPKFRQLSPAGLGWAAFVIITGIVCALLREETGAIVIGLALHLSFYYLTS